MLYCLRLKSLNPTDLPAQYASALNYPHHTSEGFWRGTLGIKLGPKGTCTAGGLFPGMQCARPGGPGPSGAQTLAGGLRCRCCTWPPAQPPPAQPPAHHAESSTQVTSMLHSSFAALVETLKYITSSARIDSRVQHFILLVHVIAMQTPMRHAMAGQCSAFHVCTNVPCHMIRGVSLQMCHQEGDAAWEG